MCQIITFADFGGFCWCHVVNCGFLCIAKIRSSFRHLSRCTPLYLVTFQIWLNCSQSENFHPQRKLCASSNYNYTEVYYYIDITSYGISASRKSQESSEFFESYINWKQSKLEETLSALFNFNRWETLILSGVWILRNLFSCWCFLCWLSADMEWQQIFLQRKVKARD